MQKNFIREIKYLLGKVPKAQWKDPNIRGIVYDFTPWHRMSSVTVQTSEDDPRDIGGWKYYYSAESDNSRIKAEIEQYQQANDWRVYHKLLLEAAEALLAIDFSKYGQPNTSESFRLYKPFSVQVYHGDEIFGFNY
ncbi:MAG: hypothetical protein JWO38_2569 [Gemmataceae bacterium]|nr:hypothetical protein [Gemmataceae bacterium]